MDGSGNICFSIFFKFNFNRKCQPTPSIDPDRITRITPIDYQLTHIFFRHYRISENIIICPIGLKKALRRNKEGNVALVKEKTQFVRSARVFPKSKYLFESVRKKLPLLSIYSVR